MNKIIALILALAMIFALTGCGYNKQLVDMNYKFNYAYIYTPGGVIEGSVSSWNDWEDSDMIQVKIDGTVYYTHSSNVVLMYR